MQKLKDWYFALKPRERLLVSIGAVLVVLVAVYSLALKPFYTAVGARAQRVAQKEGDLAWIRSVSGELMILNANAPAAGVSSGESLVVLIDHTARECGLSQALTGQTPNGETAIRVRLESADFDKLLVCLGSLQKVHSISVESATIDRTDKPGFVNASLVLNRPGG